MSRQRSGREVFTPFAQEVHGGLQHLPKTRPQSRIKQKRLRVLVPKAGVTHEQCYNHPEIPLVLHGMAHVDAVISMPRREAEFRGRGAETVA